MPERTVQSQQFSFLTGAAEFLPVDLAAELLEHRDGPVDVAAAADRLPVELVLVLFQELFGPVEVVGEVLPGLFLEHDGHQAVIQIDLFHNVLCIGF